MLTFSLKNPSNSVSGKNNTKMLKFCVAVFLVVTALNCFSNVQHAAAAAECKADSDCVPAVCCHSGFCVNKRNAPKCTGTLCTQECMPWTTDCGGSCFCDQTMGKCQAHFGNASLPIDHPHHKKMKYMYFRAKVGPRDLHHGHRFHG